MSIKIRKSIIIFTVPFILVLLGVIFLILIFPPSGPVVANTPPTAPIVFITPTPAYDDDTLICSILFPSSDPDNDSISYTYIWVLNGTLTDIITDTVQANETMPNDVWQCYVTPFDGMNVGKNGTDTVVIEKRLPIEPSNTPPTAPVVSINPNPAYTNMSLFCNITTPSTDEDNDTIVYHYEWFVNGSVTGFTGPNLSSIHTYANDEWTCVVTPFDGQNYGPSGNDVIIIQNDGIPTPKNTPPTIPVVIISPDPAYSNDTLSCTISVPSNDSDNDTIIYLYEWYLNDNLTNLTGSTVFSNQTSVGDIWKCVVTPYDGIDYGFSADYTSIIHVVASGTYSLSPIIAYSCALGLYDISYSSFTFIDTGTTLTVQPLMNNGGYMIGASAAHGIINAIFVYPGGPTGCTETYTLVGDFITEDIWQATFTILFSNNCMGCLNVEWLITGTRI